MALDSDDETEEGWQSLLIKARIVKGEKNQLIKERKIIPRGVVNYIKNMWFKREEVVQERIEKLQDREMYYAPMTRKRNYLYRKVRVSQKLFEQTNNRNIYFIKQKKNNYSFLSFKTNLSLKTIYRNLRYIYHLFIFAIPPIFFAIFNKDTCSQ